MRRSSTLLTSAAAMALAVVGARGGEGEEFFEKKIRPLFVENCAKCHSQDAGKIKGGLRLDSRETILRGGDSGPAVVPGDVEKSAIIHAVRYADKDMQMPPPKDGEDRKLSDAQIADLCAWVKMGAPMPAAAADAHDPANHWSFQPVKNPPVPKPADSAWVKTSIDAFLFTTQPPAPPADKRTLLRRATYDLTGLPPTPEECDAFLADTSPAAFEKVVDRLLASPGYGEKWGRKWLDVVHYSDSAGNNTDHPVPLAWRYRNYVINAFNHDLPYDEFLREQIAGDLIATTQPRERFAECVTATGFLAISRRFGSGKDDHEFYLTIEDTIDTLGKAVLGLTVGCARCHNHKTDPITARDYYGLYGIFASTRYSFPGGEENQRARDLVPLLPPAEVAEVAKIEAQNTVKAETENRALRRVRWAMESMVGKVAALKDRVLCNVPPLPAGDVKVRNLDMAYAVADGKIANAHVQKRGDPLDPGDEVPRKNIDMLGGQIVPPEAGSGRDLLARWLTEPANPLTARVMVNRIWQGHFGRGLVATPNDFGLRGAPPTHPELLDHLATKFVESGWRMKAMHRLIVLSAAYQQTSLAEGGFTRRRLDAEEIRDTYLAFSGELDRTPNLGHPFPHEDTWAYSQHVPFKDVFESQKRGVYLMAQRLQKHPFLSLFDGPDSNTSTPVRDASTVPTQALWFLNDPFIHARSESFARRLFALPDDTQRVKFAYRLCLQREPDEAEIRKATSFLSLYQKESQSLFAAWSAYSRVLLSSNEVLYLD